MTIVIGYHGNEESNQALSAGLAIAEQREQQIVVVLARKLTEDDPTTSSSAEDRLWQRLREANVPYEVRRADVTSTIAENILQTAQSLAAQLVVIGLRSRTEHGVRTIGPNASRILVEAPCPVLTTTSTAITQW